MKIYRYLIEDTITRSTDLAITVCFCLQWISSRAMQAKALEIESIKTAFVFRPKPNGKEFSIRFFSKVTEIDLCYDLVFAAAQEIMSNVPDGNVQFRTGHDEIIIARKANEQISLETSISLPTPCPPHPSILRILRVNAVKFFFSIDYNCLFIELRSQSEVFSVSPDFHRLSRTSSRIKSVVLTSPAAHQSEDFCVRIFSPWIGINEDILIGTAHVMMARYWHDKSTKNLLIPCGYSGVIHLTSQEEGKVRIVNHPCRLVANKVLVA